MGADSNVSRQEKEEGMGCLEHLVWMCTRAEEGRYAYSLGSGRASPEELNSDEARRLLSLAMENGAIIIVFLCC